MADFNPATPGQSADFVGRSRGQQAPQAQEYTNVSQTDIISPLIKGVADTFFAGVKAVDYRNTKAIEEELNTSFDQVRREYGVDDAVAIQQNMDVSQLPEDIQRAYDGLQKNQKAYRAGTIKDSTYEARLESVVRQMRAKHPGYRSEIDQLTQKLTGMTPANELVKSLRQEAQAKEQVDPKTKLIKENLEHSEDIIGRYESMTEKDIMLHISKRKAAKFNMEQDQAQLAKDVSEGKVVREQAYRTFDKVIQQEMSLILSKNSGGAYATLVDAAEAIMKGAKDGVYDPVQLEALQKSTLDLRTKIVAKREEVIARGINGGGLHPEDVEKIRKSSDELFNNLVEPLAGKLTPEKMSAVTAAANHFDAIQTAQGLKILNDPHLGALAAAGKQLGGQVVSSVLAQVPGSLLKTHGAIIKMETEAIVSGERPLKKAIIGEGKDGKTAKAIIDNTYAMLFDPKATDKVKRNVMEGIFGPGNQGFLGNVGDGIEGKTKVLNALSNKRVAELAYSMKGTNPELWDNYKSWVFDSTYNLNKSLFDNLQNQIIDKGDFTVKYNNKTKQLDYEIVGDFNSIKVSQAQRALAPVNRILSSLSSIYDIEGKDVAQEFDRNVMTYINLNDTRKTLYSRIHEAFTSYMNKPKEQGGEVNPPTEDQLPFPKPSGLGLKQSDLEGAPTLIKRFFEPDPNTGVMVERFTNLDPGAEAATRTELDELRQEYNKEGQSRLTKRALAAEIASLEKELDLIKKQEAQPITARPQRAFRGK